MTPTYTVLIPPSRVSPEQVAWVREYRRRERITTGEALRRCIAALQENGKDFVQAPYGSSGQFLAGFLVDASTAQFMDELAFEKDVSRSQIVRSAIDVMMKEQIISI